MLRRLKKVLPVAIAAVAMVAGCVMFSGTSKAVNPYMPMWEHIPDGEPYVFEDPDNPGTYRLYVYGSHDTRLTNYCGYDLVAWSAPLDDLTNWRYDGVIFESIVNGNPDVLFAPDMALVTDEDGNKTYYLYPNNQAGGRNGMVASSDSPIGPFEVCNWKPGSNTSNNGVLGFDPAVFVDDDGRVYGYWGFQESFMAELNPDDMATIKEGCSRLTEAETGIDNCNNPNGIFRFFEASSMRKIKMNGQSKYVFIYSRMSQNGEFGMGASNATLAYAYSDTPLGPWEYGGTIVDARAREYDENGKVFDSFSAGNTHGSIVEVNGQWYIFYHRCINNDQYSRQGTAEPIDVMITDDGKVVISEAEVTSQGLEINGLNPYKKLSAGAMCYRKGSSYVKATYDKEVDSSPVVKNINGNIIGYKYFNFDLPGWQHLVGFNVELQTKNVEGSITLMIDSPWESKGGKEIGTIEIAADDYSMGVITKSIDMKEHDTLTGKHALYMIFKGPSGKEIADIHSLQFIGDGIEPTPTPEPTPTVAPHVTLAPTHVAVPSATPAPAVKKGDIITIKKLKYVVTSVKEGRTTVALAGTTDKKIKSLIIPASIKKNGIVYKVTEIKAKSFSGCKKLATLTIGKNINTIGSKAFSNCKQLKKVTVLTKSLKKVGSKAFAGTAKLSVKYPAGLAKKYKRFFR